MLQGTVRCSAILILLAAAPLARSAPDAPALPGDAVGFVSVNVKALLASQFGQGLIEPLTQASPALLKALHDEVALDPTTLDRISLVWPKSDRPDDFVVVLRSTAPLDLKRVAAWLPTPVTETKLTGLERAWQSKNLVLGVVPGGQVALFGPRDIAAAALATMKKSGPIQEMLTSQAKAHVVAGVDLAALPGFHDELQSDRVPQVIQPMVPLGLARFATASLTLGDKQTTLTARFDFADEEAAKAGLKAAKVARAMALAGMGAGRGMLAPMLKPPMAGQSSLDELPQAAGALAGLGGLQVLGDWLRDLPLTVNGSTLSTETVLPLESQQFVFGAGVGIGLLLPAVEKVREAANRSRDMNNLKQLGLAFHIYADQQNKFPAAVAFKTKDGKPGLSWRVALLPYLEQEALYKQFHLDEPWDSEHNLKLLEKMPDVYRSVSLPDDKPGYTRIKVFTGPHTPFPPEASARLPATFLDGTSNTILMYQGNEAVPWTKPVDTPYDPEKPLPALVGPHAGGVLVGMADGSVRMLVPKVTEKTRRALITPAGGELIEENW